MKKKPATTQSPTLEIALARLTEIADLLAGDGLELQEALGLFAEGVTLLRTAESTLNEAEARVSQLLGDEEGWREQPLIVP